MEMKTFCKERDTVFMVIIKREVDEEQKDQMEKAKVVLEQYQLEEIRDLTVEKE